MQKREIQIIFLASVILIIFFFSAFIFLMNFYDRNSYLSFLEKFIFSTRYNKDLNKIIKDEKFSSITLFNKISSKYFIFLIDLLLKNEAKIIVVQFNTSFLNDNQYLKDLEEILIKNNNIFFVLTMNNKKGFFYNPNNYFIDRDLLEKLYTLTDPSLLYFANCKGEVNIKSSISIPENRLCFVKEKIELFDDNNIDLAYKINDKLIFSLLFLLKLKEENVNLDDIRLKNLSVIFKEKKYYYDQKARMSFLPSIIPNKKDFDIIDFSFINEAIESRLRAFDIVKEILKKEISFEEDLNNYIKLINNLEKNAKLQEAKKLIDRYDNFLKANIEKIKDRIICICFEKDQWVKNFIFQKRVLNNNINLRRLPIELIIVLSFLLFSLTFLLVVKIRRRILLSLVLLFTLVCIFIAFRFFLFIDLPLVGLIFSILASILCYYVIFYIEIKLWENDIKSLFNRNLSDQHIKKIVELIKTKKWSPEKKEVLTTFLYLDLSNALTSEINKDNIDILAEFNRNLTQVINKYFGIIYDLGVLKKVVAFGNPPVTENHAFDAINCAKEIVLTVEKSEIFNKNKIHLLIHSKTEWFMLFHDYKVYSYNFSGEVVEIFSYMLKYAKKFRINVLVTETILKLCDYNLDIRMLDRVRLINLKQSLRLFELLTEKSEEKEKLINYFHAGMKLFLNRKWEEAGKYFKQCLKITKEDLPSEIFLERCKEYIYVSPDPEWDGVYEIDFY